MSFRDRVATEKAETFKSVLIDDFDPQFHLRSVLLCPLDEQTTVTTLIKSISEESEDGADNAGLVEKLRSLLVLVADNHEAAEAYFADYDLADLLSAVKLYQADTQFRGE